jgi:hypothetical protein
MANRRRNATTGWKAEARQEDIDSAVARTLGLEGPRVYLDAYEKATEMIAEGRQANAIRRHLARTPHTQSFSPDDTEKRADQKKISNAIDVHLCKAARQGVDDALAGRQSNYQMLP